MRITVVGAGYVGLSNALLLSKKNTVIVHDTDIEKVEKLNSRISTLEEEDIKKFLQREDIKFSASLDRKVSYEHADYVLIATPTDYDPESNYFDYSLEHLPIYYSPHENQLVGRPLRND